MLDKDTGSSRGWDSSAITLYRLRIFCEVVEQRSFTAAAEHLYLTQPAVSLQVRALERALGTELLYQEGHRTLLTQAGEAFYQYACGVLQQATDVQATLHDLTTGQSGVLSIGATRTPGTYLLPGVLRRFVASNDRVLLNVYVDATQSICARVLRGDLDLGLVQMAKIPDSLASCSLRREPMVIVASPRHALASLAAVELSALADEPFACAPLGTATRAAVDAGFRAHGVERTRVVVQFTHPESIKRVVQGSDLLAVLCASSVQQELDLGLLRPIPATGYEAWQEFGLIYRPRKHFSPLLMELATVIQAELSTPGQESGPPGADVEPTSSKQPPAAHPR
jgi:DNA-binding transcriptional LysR family regulator